LSAKCIKEGERVSHQGHIVGVIGISMFIIVANIIGLNIIATGLLCDLFGVIILLLGKISVINYNRRHSDGAIWIDEIGGNLQSTIYVLKESPSAFLGMVLVILGFFLQFLGAINIRIPQILLEPHQFGLVLNILGVILFSFGGGLDPLIREDGTWKTPDEDNTTKRSIMILKKKPWATLGLILIIFGFIAQIQ
jgi:hypothetical protein